jgi:quercetin dioxygenase-like cupin family protein
MRAPGQARRRLAALAAGAALVAAGVALSFAVRATPASKFSVDVLADAQLPAGKQFATHQAKVEIDRLTLRPGGEIGWHAHDGPLMLLVAKGTLTNYLAHGSGCVRSQVRPGRVLLESAGRAHLARNEGTGDVVVYAVNNYSKGGTGSVEAKRPAGCAVRGL